MKYLYLFISVFLFVSVSCSDNDSNNNKEEELAILNQQKNVIEEMAASIACTDSSTCKFIAFGSKPCGGPWTYITYNATIDEVLFLNMVANYNNDEDAYNIKWNVVSDCAAALPPTGVDCIDGVCVPIY